MEFELAHVLTTFGGLIGMVGAYLLIKLVSFHATKVEEKKLRHYLSINSVIYNHRDWM